MKLFKGIFLAATFTLTLLCVIPDSFCADKYKIGIIDFQRILEKSKAGEAAQEEINKAGKKMEKDLKKKRDEIKELEKQLERDAMVMSEEIRQEKVRNVRIKINDIRSLQKKYVENFKKLEASIITQIQREVFAISKELGEKKGYFVILEKQAGGVIYFADAISLTDKLIESYNKEYLKKN